MAGGCSSRTTTARTSGPQKALSLIALPSGDTIKTIDLGEYRAPHDVRWVDGSRVVVTAEASQALLLVNVDIRRHRARVQDRRRRVAHARALDRSHAPLLLEHARRQRQRVRFQDRPEDQGRQDRQGMRRRRRHAGRPLGVGRQSRRGHDLDHRHEVARSDQANPFAWIPVSRAVHARRQVGADPARASLVAGRRRRGEAGDPEVDSARPDEDRETVDGRRVPASRQPSRIRDGAQRQLDAGARSRQRQTLARVEVQISPDGVTYSPVQRQ